ncbi:MAG: family 43 glycosylhydrolase [Massilia sp.]
MAIAFVRWLLALAFGAACAWSAASPQAPTYRNPLPLRLADGTLAENCADPALQRDHASATPQWYLFCTSDPVSRSEKDGKDWKFHLLPTYRSTDLVHWDFAGDAFAERPAGLAAPKAGLWAPEPAWMNGRYYLYFTITDVADARSPEPGCEGDSAIGVATSASPAGPWQASPAPVVGPRRAGPGCSFHWTFDPKVIVDADGRKFIYYGSYGGGIFVQRLADDGLSVTGEAVRVGASGRYEGAEVVWHDGAWYLFASATDCCNGPLTGYALYVGRATRPEGPFLDRQGKDMAAARAGGTPLLAQNGNRWVGSGHNTVFADAAGQWWTIYHAIDRGEPYFSVKDRLTRRVAMLDRIDWVDGWPVAADGRGPSDEELPAPSTVPGAKLPPPRPGALVATGPGLWSDRFTGARLDRRWSWVRPRGRDSWSTGAGGLRLATEAADLHGDTNNASLLATALPAGDYRIEVELHLDAPDSCCARPVQAGLVVFRDDDNYIKLVELAHDGLRQVEFAKELAPVDAGYPRYGNTVVGTPGATTWLRLDVRRAQDGERYTAWSSQDGRGWVGGGVWTHNLGPSARLGLVAMGGAGYGAVVTRVAVSRLPH